MSPFGSATLVVSGPTGKHQFEISGDKTTVGRTRDNEIVLQDPAVSSHHCEFVADPRGLVLNDLNSSNGSYVNGKRVQSVTLYDGDAVKIGQFQGRIQVRAADGQPLKAPSNSKLLFAVAGVLFALALVGGLLVMREKQSKEERADAFMAYEKKAKAYLAIEPCSAAEDAVRRLGSIDRMLTPPEFGKNGKLGKPEKARNEELIALSRRKEPIAEKVLKEVAGLVEKQRAGLEGLKGASDAFTDPEFAAVAKSLDATFAERLQVGEQFREQWRKFGEQVGEFNALLERFNTTGDRGAQAELDGWKYRLEPEAALRECKERQAKLQSAALGKLDEVSL